MMDIGQKQSHINTVNEPSIVEQTQFSGERVDFQQMVLQQLDFRVQKTNQDTGLTSFTN